MGRPNTTWRRAEEKESRQERYRAAGPKSRVQHKTWLVGEGKLQPYAPHGAERTN